MKRTIFLCILVLLIPSWSNCQENENVDNLINNLKLEDFNTFMDEVLEEADIKERRGLKELSKDLIKGEKIIKDGSIIETLKNLFFKEIINNLSFLSKLLVIAIISSIVSNLQGSFEESSVSELTNYVIYILMGILVLSSFNQVIDSMKISVDRMTNLMELLMPLLLTLLIVTSGLNTKSIFHPMILGLVNIVGIIIKNIILPLIVFSFILSILSNLSNKIELSKLSDLSRKVIVFIITASFTIFIGFLTIYGLASKIDGLSIRTAKFAVDKFIPIVGSFLSDAVDTVISSATILKNGMGIVGLALLVIVIISPLVKIITILFAYNLIGALVEPIVAKNISQFFTDISKTFLMVLITMVSMAIMFFITITMIVDTGNSLLMLR